MRSMCGSVALTVSTKSASANTPVKEPSKSPGFALRIVSNTGRILAGMSEILQLRGPVQRYVPEKSSPGCWDCQAVAQPKGVLPFFPSYISRYAGNGFLAAPPAFMVSRGTHDCVCSGVHLDSLSPVGILPAVPDARLCA